MLWVEVLRAKLGVVVPLAISDGCFCPRELSGKMNYLMLAFRKEDRHADTGMKQCAPVPVLALGEESPVRKPIQRHLMTGEREKNGKKGGTRQQCLSGW